MSTQNSKTPLIIIGAVVVVALVGVFYLMNRDKTSPVANNNKPTNTAKAPAVTAAGAVPPNVLGSQTSSVVVEEFADFQCPTCGVVHPKMKEIVATYGSRIKFIFRNFPLAIPAHDKAYDAAVAAEAAGLQGRFFEMQNLLFSNQGNWSSNPDYRKIWEDYAKQLGLDVEKFKNDMAGLNAKARVDADLNRGRALNVNSTPSIFINGQLAPLNALTDVTAMRQLIDAELAKVPAASSQTAPSAPAAAPVNANAAKK